MYLNELLSLAVLEENPSTDNDMVLVSPESTSWCDIPMIVTRDAWEEIYTKYRGKEPDIELIAKLLTRADNKDFMSKFADTDAVRDIYTRLRTEKDGTSVAPSTNEEIEDSAAESDVAITDESSTATVLTEGANDAATAPESGPVNPDMLLEEMPNHDSAMPEPAMETAGPSLDLVTLFANAGLDSADIEQEANVEDKKPSDDFERDDMASDFANEEEEQEEFGGMSLAAAATVCAPLPPEPSETDSANTSSEPTYDTTSEVEVGSAASEQEASVPVPGKEEQLALCLHNLQRDGEIFLDVPEWAEECTKLFIQMLTDFESVFEDVSVDTVLSANGYTTASFLDKWRDINWGVAGDADFIELTTASQFLDLVKNVYGDCLRFLASDATDRALDLARMFAKLIYEE